MESALATGLIAGGSIAAGILAGPGAVYVFNRIPPDWLRDYGETPEDRPETEERLRLRSYPWKPALSMVFVLMFLKLAAEDWRFAIPSAAALWVLGEIALADGFFRIIPDQFLGLLAITAMGFIPYYPSFAAPFLGAAAGALPVLLIYLAGRLLFRKEALGMGDVKLMGVIGFVLGWKGALFTFLCGFFTAGLYMGIRLLFRKTRKGSEEPLGPFLACSAAWYLVFYAI